VDQVHRQCKRTPPTVHPPNADAEPDKSLPAKPNGRWNVSVPSMPTNEHDISLPNRRCQTADLRHRSLVSDAPHDILQQIDQTDDRTPVYRQQRK
jgi:hypothetical protein